ncbi:hypothetical protein HAX54_031087, partial [Datura stramonium]|nr:hypothetical protein [Datura stramonium]
IANTAVRGARRQRSPARTAGAGRLPTYSMKRSDAKPCLHDGMRVRQACSKGQ